jgi:hypothetical protein
MKPIAPHNYTILLTILAKKKEIAKKNKKHLSNGLH